MILLGEVIIGLLFWAWVIPFGAKIEEKGLGLYILLSGLVFGTTGEKTTASGLN